MKIEKGQTLISEPFMPSGSFREAVILICDVHRDGVVGFIVNKTIEMNINDLISDFPSFNSEVLYGGPVMPDTVHYVHKYGDLIPGAHHVVNDLYWGGDYEILKSQIISGKIEPSKIKFFVGYSGWSAGQLEEELKEATWVKCNVDLDFIFQDDDKEIWKNVLKGAGDKYAILSEIPQFFNPN